MKKILAILIATTAPAGAFERYCPDEEIPYTFTAFEDVVTINRAYHRAFCQAVEGNKFECLEKWPGDDNPSVYAIEVDFLKDHTLSVKLPSDDQPMIVKACQ